MVQNSSGLFVRAYTAVRPYAEDLSYEARSAIVRWQYKVRNRPSCPRVPVLETRIRIFDPEHEFRHHGRAWQPSPTQNLLDHDGAKIGHPERCGRTRRSAPTRRICHTRPIRQLSVGESIIENAPVARGYRFGNREHGHLTQNMKSITAGGRGSPPLHGFLDHSYPSNTSTPSATAAASSCLSSDASLAPRVRAQWM